jgi:Flp pilus assembly protein TadD
MIAASVDTNEFSQVIPQERFSVDAPATNPPMAASSLDITRTQSGLDFSIAEKTEISEPRSVELVLSEAIDRCKRDLERYPQTARAMLNLALAFINAGDSGAGLEMLHKILEIEPNNYAALSSLGLLHFNRGDLSRAEETYNRMHSAFPNDPNPLINLASIALRNGDFFVAATYLEKAVGLNRCPVTAKHLLAMILLQLGKHNRAVSLLRTALRDHGPSAELSQGLAIAYLASGDSKRAERAFLTCLAVNKNMLSAVHGLALLRMQEHRWDEVIEVLQDHLGRFRDDSQARELLAGAYVGLNSFSRARNQLMMLVPSDETTPENRAWTANLFNNIGFCYANERKGKEAEFWLKRSLVLDGKAASAPYSNLARVLLSQGRVKEGLKVVTEAHNAGLANNDTNLLKATLLVELERHDEAISVLQTLISTGSAPSSAYSDLGSLLAEWREDVDDAVSILREGLRRDPTNKIMLNNLAYVYLMRGETKLARAVLDQVEEDDSTAIIFAATRGLLCLLEGDIEAGDQLYKEAETLAFHRGLKKLAVSVRQKRCLEVARAYIRNGRVQEASELLKIGTKTLGGMRFYPFQDQLLSLSQKFMLDAGI